MKDLSIIVHCLIILNLWLKAFLCFLACCCKLMEQIWHSGAICVIWFNWVG